MFIGPTPRFIASLRQERHVAPLGLYVQRAITGYKHLVPNGTPEVLLRSSTVPHMTHFLILCDRPATNYVFWG